MRYNDKVMVGLLVGCFMVAVFLIVGFVVYFEVPEQKEAARLAAEERQADENRDLEVGQVGVGEQITMPEYPQRAHKKLSTSTTSTERSE